MAASIHDVVALTLLSNDGEITGKTAMQKLVYFQTEKIPEIGIRDYVHYFYGPFSRRVAAALHEMSAFLLVDVDMMSQHNNAYRYRLTDDGKSYAERTASDNPEMSNSISDIVAKCKEHCGLQSNPLSYAAKSHYILKYSRKRKDDKYTVDDIKDVAKYFGWHIDTVDTENGIKLLRTLDLVS